MSDNKWFTLWPRLGDVTPGTMTDEDKAAVRKLFPPVEWNKVDMDIGVMFTAAAGVDPNTEKGRRVVFGLAIAQYIKKNREPTEPNIEDVADYIVEAWLPLAADNLPWPDQRRIDAIVHGTNMARDTLIPEAGIIVLDQIGRNLTRRKE